MFYYMYTKSLNIIRKKNLSVWTLMFKCFEAHNYWTEGKSLK